jgi:hypothetical protein
VKISSVHPSGTGQYNSFKLFLSHSPPTPLTSHMQTFIKTISSFHRITQIRSKLTPRVFFQHNKIFSLPFSRSFFSKRQKIFSNIAECTQSIRFSENVKSHRIFGPFLPNLFSRRRLFVYTQHTPNPETMKFIPGLFYSHFFSFLFGNILIQKTLNLRCSCTSKETWYSRLSYKTIGC